MYTKLTKFQIGETQLFRSIAIYIEGEDLVSAITLAGAADEMLGQMNRASGQKAALDDKVESLCSMYEAAFKEPATPKNFVELRNKARNAFKHFGSDEEVELDLEREASGLIRRAINNYKKLKHSFNARFREFEAEALRRYRLEQAEILKE